MASFSSQLPAMMTLLAPAMFASCAASCPMGPSPITSTSAPAGILALLTAYMAVAAGSARAASSMDTFSGILYTCRWGTATYSAKTPCRFR